MALVRRIQVFIQAAGQEGDVDHAISVFRRLQQMQLSLVDPMAFNIVIDACASNKDMHCARELVEEMRQAQFCNLVTINALMKGYIAALT